MLTRAGYQVSQLRFELIQSDPNGNLRLGGRQPYHHRIVPGRWLKLLAIGNAAGYKHSGKQRCAKTVTQE